MQSIRTYEGHKVIEAYRDECRALNILKLDGGNSVALTDDMLADEFGTDSRLDVRPYRMEWQTGLKVQTYNSVARISSPEEVRSDPWPYAKPRVNTRNAVIQKMGFGQKKHLQAA